MQVPLSSLYLTSGFVSSYFSLQYTGMVPSIVLHFLLSSGGVPGGVVVGELLSTGISVKGGMQAKHTLSGHGP